MRNPSFTERQRVMACMDLVRLRKKQKTRTGMKKADLREFCRKPVVPKSQRKGKWMKKVRAYRKKHKKNPHLGGKWKFVGMFEVHDCSLIKRTLRPVGIKHKITKDHYHGDTHMRELYVTGKDIGKAQHVLDRVFKVQT